MKKQKQIYVSPETETLVVRFEGVVCGSQTGEKFGTQSEWDDSDDWTDSE